ncbi:thiamine diphosphokinase [Treponema sp. R6D11]
MLGIIFTGGESPKAEVVKRLLETEAKGALIIAADSGLMAALNADVNPDWVIGDMDSLEDQSCLSAVPPERVIRHQHEKDFTDTELAFLLAEEKGCDDIWILGGGGGRIDHLFGIRSLFERAVFPRRWITETEDIRCIDANTLHSEAFCRLTENARVSVFPLGEGRWEASSKGLKWQLDGLHWDRGFFGLSNEAEDGDFYIKAKAGRFMVITFLEEI